MTVNEPLTKVNRQRTDYFDILRVLAIFLLVPIHLATQNWRGVTPGSYEWNVFIVYKGIGWWGTLDLIMISGALFLTREHPIKKIYKKNIFHLVTAFAFWSFLYASKDFIKTKDIGYAVKHFFTGHYHMWFIYMIIGIYMIVPFLKKIVETRKLAKYFLILSFFLTFLIPQILLFTALAPNNSLGFLQSIYDNSYFHFTLGYTAYFVLGYYLNKYDISKRNEIIIYILGIISFLATIIMTSVLSAYIEDADQLFYGMGLNVNILFVSAAFFVLFKNHYSTKKMSEKTKGFIRLLAKYSFGIYLSHALIIELLNKVFGINSLSFNPLISIPLISILVYVIAATVTAVLAHIPIAKKYFI